MDVKKIDNAVARLERNLPIRRNQTRLPESLRHLRRWKLRYYLEAGRAPAAGDRADVDDWQAAPGNRCAVCYDPDPRFDQIAIAQLAVDGQIEPHRFTIVKLAINGDKFRPKPHARARLRLGRRAGEAFKLLRENHAGPNRVVARSALE